MARLHLSNPSPIVLDVTPQRLIVPSTGPLRFHEVSVPASRFFTIALKPPTPNRSQFLYVPEQRWSKRYFKAAHLEPTAFLTYNELLTKMYGTNPRAPPLVKMDIEGYEWDMIPEVVQSRFRPLQLQFELHLQTQMPGLTWFGRTKSAAEVLALSMLLKDAGYRMAHRKDNPWCARCTELLYVL